MSCLDEVSPPAPPPRSSSLRDGFGSVIKHTSTVDDQRGSREQPMVIEEEEEDDEIVVLPPPFKYVYPEGRTRSVVDDMFHRHETEELRKEIQHLDVLEFDEECAFKLDQIRMKRYDLLNRVHESCSIRGHFDWMCLNVLKVKETNKSI